MHPSCVCQGLKHINSLLLVKSIFKTLPQKKSIPQGKESGAQELTNITQDDVYCRAYTVLDI